MPGAVLAQLTDEPPKYRKFTNECATEDGRRSEESEYAEGNDHKDDCKLGCSMMEFCTAFEYYPIRNEAHIDCWKRTKGDGRTNKCRCMLSITTWGEEKPTEGFVKDGPGNRYGNVSCYVK